MNSFECCFLVSVSFKRTLTIVAGPFQLSHFKSKLNQTKYVFFALAGSRLHISETKSCITPDLTKKPRQEQEFEKSWRDQEQDYSQINIYKCFF